MIKINGCNYKKFYFPSGEMQIDLSDLNLNSHVFIFWEFEKTEELIELLFVVKTIRDFGSKFKIILDLPYIPFSRMDRAENKKNCFSLRIFSEIINSLNLDMIHCYDPHSDVSRALIKNLNVIEQHDIFKNHFRDKSDFYLVSPDSGALKKINKLAAIVNPIDVIECSKKRNFQTGEITGTKVHHQDFEGKDCYIVDDICEKGRTFIEIAKILKQRNAGKIILMVTHGFFSKGLGVFDNLIDEIYTKDGKVK